MIRHTTHLRAALQRQAIAWTARQRIVAKLDRYDATPGPQGDQPANLVLDHLIEIGEICCTPDNKRLPSADWICAAIKNHLDSNPEA